MQPERLTCGAAEDVPGVWSPPCVPHGYREATGQAETCAGTCRAL